MKSDEDKLYIKIVDLDKIYNFIVGQIFYRRSQINLSKGKRIFSE